MEERVPLNGHQGTALHDTSTSAIKPKSLPIMPTSQSASNTLPLEQKDKDAVIKELLRNHDGPILFGRLANETDTETISLTYLAEGAANFVFSSRPWKAGASTAPIRFDYYRENQEPVPACGEFLGKVFRSSKCLPKTPSIGDVYKDFNVVIQPLFKHESLSPEVKQCLKKWEQWEYDTTLEGYLLEPLLVYFDDEVEKTIIAEVQKQNQTIRRGRDLKQPFSIGRSAFLLEDMSTIPGKSLTIEIKPKWLAQSPIAEKVLVPAPYRCRTCAMQRVYQIKGKKTKAYICPIQLLAGNVKYVRPWVHEKVHHEVGSQPAGQLHSRLEAAIVDAITKFLCSGIGHLILLQLKHQQVEFDTLAATDFPYCSEHIDDEDVKNLRTAMTLRDCSMFIRAEYDNDFEHYDGSEGDAVTVDAKLGDLDFKDVRKFDDWLEKEHMLLNGGFYAGKEVEGKVRKNDPLHCLVTEQFWQNHPHRW